jgi:hypothetical protein
VERKEHIEYNREERDAEKERDIKHWIHDDEEE